MQGRTIQFYLPTGNPQEIKIAEITSRAVQVISFSRAAFAAAIARAELTAPALYFLFGETDNGQPLAYIGETENATARLKQHQTKKKDWVEASVVVSKTAQFTKTHVKYLEWFAYRRATEASRYVLDKNIQVPSCPHLQEWEAADLNDHFETATLLLTALGHPILEPKPIAETVNVLICKGKQAESIGEYKAEGFIVFSGSTANVEETKTIQGWISKLRLALLEQGVLMQEDNVYRFTKDYIFKSPSAAAATVLGRSANGWIEWKYADGRTLDEIVRQSVGGTDSIAQEQTARL